MIFSCMHERWKLHPKSREDTAHEFAPSKLVMMTIRRAGKMFSVLVAGYIGVY